MRRLLAAIVAVLVSAAPAAALASSGYERGTRLEVNQVRHHDVRHGACVNRFAERKARALAESGEFFHSTLGPIARRCNGVLVGEVLARGFEHPSQVVAAWMQSPGHHAVITNEYYRRVGVGAVQRDGQWTVVAIFIRH